MPVAANIAIVLATKCVFVSYFFTTFNDFHEFPAANSIHKVRRMQGVEMQCYTCTVSVLELSISVTCNKKKILRVPSSGHFGMCNDSAPIGLVNLDFATPTNKLLEAIVAHKNGVSFFQKKRHSNTYHASQNTRSAHEDIFELNFVCRPNSRPSILNSTVVGRDGFTPYFHIMSNSERTVFRTNEGRTVAQIDWRANSAGSSPYVEVRNAVAKQRVSRWLPVSEDGSYRMMTVQRSRYVWVPQTDCICMYNWNPEMFGNVPQLLARMENPTQGQDQTVKFEIAVDAMNRGLLEMTVVAATLFQAGRPID